MVQGLSLQDFQDLLLMRSGQRWKWTDYHFTPEAALVSGRALQGHVGSFWNGTQVRPLGIMVVRLLWELGELYLKRDPGGQVTLGDDFVVEGMVNVKFGLSTPWFSGDLSPTMLDVFLCDAMVAGDGVLRGNQSLAYGKGIRAISNNRSFFLDWRETPERGNQVLGTGYEPEQVADLEMAIVPGGGAPQVYRFGKPWFNTRYWPSKANRVRFPSSIAGILPDTYEWNDEGQWKRFFVPGTESGSHLEIEGHVFLDHNRTPPRSVAYHDEAPGIRIHLHYLPGWQSGNGAGGGCRVLEWSALTDSQRAFHLEWSPFLGEDGDHHGFGDAMEA